LGYLLRNSGKIIKNKNANATIVGDPTRNNLSKRGRKRVYGKEVLEILKVLYRISGYVSSKHLVWFIRINHEKLFENPKIKSNLTDDIKLLLLRISPATVDRLLKPYRKNDSCYVESKNWSMVRSYTGWNRYDTDEELKVLQVLLKLVCLKNNLFMPQMKYIEKIRINGKIIKRYEIDTPLNRVLRLKEVDEKVKSDLLRLRDAIDIAELSKEIERITEELFLTYNKKLKRRNNYA